MMTFMMGALVYAADWQREQDRKMADLDKLISKQSTLLQMRIEFDEYKANQRRMKILKPSYTEEISYPAGVEIR